MNVNINIENAELKGQAKLLCDSTISGDATINVKDISVIENAMVLSGLRVNEVCDSISRERSKMTAEETAHFDEVLSLRNGPRQKFLQALSKHLLSFAEGVAASVVASMLSLNR